MTLKVTSQFWVPEAGKGGHERKMQLLLNGSLMSAQMLFQVILAAKTFLADLARKRLKSGMDAFVASELFVASEAFAATGHFTNERTFASVNASVTFELTVV
jgi:hypothetical protein